MYTNQCIDCNNCEVDDKDKSNIKIICHLKNRTFCYGQFVNCEFSNNKSKNLRRKKK